MKKRLLVFHRTIAPYRIDFFNSLSETFDTRICLQYKNLLSQRFNYDKIASQFRFIPVYLPQLFKLKGRMLNFGYWKQLDEFDPDIVLVGEFGLDCFLVLLHRWFKRRKYKVVSICDDSYNMVMENNDFSRTHHLLRRKIVPLLDDLILVEPKVTEWYQANYGKGIFFPIIKKEEQACKEYRRLLSQSNETAARYGLSDKFVFLFVGRLVTLKNLETIMKSFSLLNCKDAALVIVGDGPERGNLERKVAENQANVLFTGRLEGDELLQWYNIARCFVLASYQESFGAVTNEALLAGCKGLISCKAGSQCLIEEGKNGYTFNPMDVEELTVKMKKVMDEDDASPSSNILRKSQMLVDYDSCMQGLVQEICHI